MKGVFFKIMLAIYSLAITIVSMIILLVSLHIIPFDTFYDVGTLLLNRATSSLILTSTSLGFLILSISFLVLSVSTDKKQKTIIKQTEIGEIMISLNTIESIALAAVRRITGLRDSKAHVTRVEQLVSVEIITTIVPDMNIPAIAEEIQTKVKSSIEKSTGLEVKSVKVRIDNLHFGYKQRVE